MHPVRAHWNEAFDAKNASLDHHDHLVSLTKRSRPDLRKKKEAELIELMQAKGAFACAVQETHRTTDKQRTMACIKSLHVEAMAKEQESQSFSPLPPGQPWTRPGEP